jgi:hypothetical protein
MILIEMMTGMMRMFGYLMTMLAVASADCQLPLVDKVKISFRWWRHFDSVCAKGSS